MISVLEIDPAGGPVYFSGGPVGEQFGRVGRGRSLGDGCRIR
jgi:hypothetical protein